MTEGIDSAQVLIAAVPVQVSAETYCVAPGGTDANPGSLEKPFNRQRAARWTDPAGGFIHAMHAHHWGGYHYRITGKKPDGTVTYEGGWQNNRQMGMHKQHCFVENIFEELDDVPAKSEAARAGLQKGDVIQAVNGKPVKQMAEFLKVVGGIPAGQNIQLKIVRGQQLKTLDVRSSEGK